MISIVEPNVYPELDHTLESYLANLLARHFTSNSFGEKPVAITLLETSVLPCYQKKQSYATVGDECLFIDGSGYKKNKWPSATYYQQLGMIAYGYAAIALRPPDDLYLHIEQHFRTMSKVVQQIHQMI